MKFFIDTADLGTDGLQLIADVVQIYNTYPDFETQALVAAVAGHIADWAKTAQSIL